MDPIGEFEQQKKMNVEKMGHDEQLRRLSLQWLEESSRFKYSYNFTWLGRPIIQYPQDILAMQEVIWSYKPELILETGIAHGGSLILHASLLELCGAGTVLGIDNDIRAHNRAAIEAHPLARRIAMIQGSSVAPEVVAQVYAQALGKRVLVILDSNHSHAHVAQELQCYSPLIKRGGHLIVFDTIIEDLPNELFADRPWGKGNNPKTAVWEFLRTNDRFIVDKELEGKLLLSTAPDGYLKCIRD